MLDDDDPLVTENLWHSYKELVGKDLVFVWTRVNMRKLKDVCKLDTNKPDTDFIVEPKYQYKELHKQFFFLESNSKKDNPLGIYVYYTLHINNYWGWDHKQQRVKGFEEIKKWL